MNDSLEYAKMIEIPSSSCQYVLKRRKHLFKKKDLLKKVNSTLNNQKLSKENQTISDIDGNNQCSENCSACDENNVDCGNFNCDLCNAESKNKGKKEKIKSNIIKFQVGFSLVLAVAIVLTNIFWENSGMNRLFKNIFMPEKVEQTVDNRKPEDFKLTLPSLSAKGVSIDKGVITINGEYSLYPVTTGIVENVEKKEDGKYSVTIAHSDNFSSVTEGMDLVYFEKGDSVFQNVPLGYSAEKALVYLYNQGSLVTDYAAVENTIVFDK